jgi:hypothetical protein
MEIHYCQMYTKDGLVECGFLCGSVCRANPQRTFWVSGDFHDRIKTIGCQSWQRYMDYDERRERYGQQALTGEESRTETSSEGRTETIDGGCTLPVQELQVKSELGSCGTGNIPGTTGKDGHPLPPPVRVLQTGCNDGVAKHPGVEQSSGCNLGTCSFCKAPATIIDMGLRYCPDHAKRMGL